MDDAATIDAKRGIEELRKEQKRLLNMIKNHEMRIRHLQTEVKRLAPNRKMK